MFKGLGTALITPFTENGDVDCDALEFLVRKQIDTVDFLVPCGTTGECPTLSDKEFRGIIETVAEASDDKLPILAGTGSNDTKKAVTRTHMAYETGADGVLVVSPYYNKPTDRGLRDYYERIADVGLPVILYDIPGRTGQGVPTELIVELARDGVIAGVKWASADHNQLMDLIAETPDGFSVLSGDDAYTLELMALGGDGAISVLSNIHPSSMSNIIEACNVGNLEEARGIHYRYLPLMRAMFLETNPIPVKTAFHLIYSRTRGSKVPAKPYFRSPMYEMEKENLRVLRDTLSEHTVISRLISG